MAAIRWLLNTVFGKTQIFIIILSWFLVITGLFMMWKPEVARRSMAGKGFGIIKGYVFALAASLGALLVSVVAKKASLLAFILLIAGVVLLFKGFMYVQKFAARGINGWVEKVPLKYLRIYAATQIIIGIGMYIARRMIGLILAVVLCVLVPLPSAWSAANDKQVYVSSLTRLLQISNQEVNAEQVQRLNEARQAFQRFADDYPQSIYADDSRFVYSLIEFMGALMVPPRDIEAADQMIALMDRTVRAYPGGRIEELTYSILSQELGDAAVGGAFYMPYSSIVEYMQALKASQRRDYRTAITGYTRLKEKLAPIEDEAIAMEIYVPLYIAYMRSGKSTDARALVDAVKQEYPGSSLEAILVSMSEKKNKKNND